MLVLLLMLAGLAVMMGSNVAGRIVKGVLGLWLLLVAVQWLMQMGACLMSGMGDSPPPVRWSICSAATTRISEMRCLRLYRA